MNSKRKGRKGMETGREWKGTEREERQGRERQGGREGKDRGGKGRTEEGWEGKGTGEENVLENRKGRRVG